jgi:hypothetical protein
MGHFDTEKMRIDCFWFDEVLCVISRPLSKSDDDDYVVNTSSYFYKSQLYTLHYHSTKANKMASATVELI